MLYFFHDVVPPENNGHNASTDYFFGVDMCVARIYTKRRRRDTLDDELASE